MERRVAAIGRAHDWLRQLDRRRPFRDPRLAFRRPSAVSFVGHVDQSNNVELGKLAASRPDQNLRQALRRSAFAGIEEVRCPAGAQTVFSATSLSTMLPSEYGDKSIFLRQGRQG
jgi:hypothetical protein